MGCKLNSACVLPGIRTTLEDKKQYCDVDSNWKEQKETDEVCDNNYEFADEKISKLGIELAYAITVHNAQCSKFKRIVLPVIKPHGLDRSLIYTALTLAIEQVVFVGSWKVFRAAIMAESKIMATEVGFNLSEAMEV